ncbi:hypothetical protein BGW36DRAFT_465854 [Talaromyces proteolyticus]|uniref:DUF6603 domain-containing protein n=1 Tax=Talaromyces proteolyticus TaxID=1131652 RepID=A0AAD4KJC1_9EURO|nr:uncharacterized protein BGW36DRAFT_465854 [Talaromyces proteolyticus]KAH8689866.1 hypothetical protein BGW36DRAFT_465854 [Talaromyces proteolyticus]
MSYVDSLHISIREGDSAIHLLVDATGPRDQVRAAVLIDGGRTHRDRNNLAGIRQVVLRDPPIKQTIDWISRNYVCQGGQLKFDAIVITHWDGDHFDGITEALQNEATAVPPPPAGQIPWLKWGANNEPQTRLYCPHLGRSGIYQVDVLHDPPQVSVTTNNGRYTFAQYYDTSTNIFDVLGVELFSNHPLDPGDQHALSPSQLLAAHGNLSAGIYCVGVSERSLAQPNAPLKSTIVGSDDSLKNRSSIAAMVMWPGTPPRISHYFAGDLDDGREIAILAWLEAETPRIEKITSVKLNHHGSATSTPLELFRRFKPLNTFIPTPLNARHKHPTWPVIFTWHAWAQSVLPPPRLIAGTFPAAITREVDETGQSHWVNLHKIYPQHFDVPAFRDYIIAVNDDINAQRAAVGQPALPNEYQLFQLVPPDLQRQSNYLAGRFATIWDHHGFPDINYHWASCAAYSVTQRTVLRKSLLFVRIRSAPTDVADGQLHYVNIDDDNLILRLWGRLPELTRVNTLRTLSHSVLAIRLMLPQPPAAPAVLPHVVAPPDMRSTNRCSRSLLAAAERQIDDSLLEHACVEPGSYYVPDETNPDEMSGGEEESGKVMKKRMFEEQEKEETDKEEPKTPESPCSWVELDANEIPHLNDIKGWAIYASDLSVEEIRAKGVNNFERLSIGILDDFVMDLHCHVLWLQTKLPSEPEVGSRTMLMEDDECRCWFYDTLNAKEVSIINAAKGEVGGFYVRASLSSMGNGPTEIAPAWMEFSTDEATLKTTFGSIEPILPTGLFKRHCMLVMGLKPVTVKPSKTVYLHDLVDFIGVEELKENTLIKLLGSFPMRPPSNHEELQGKRNAVWFLPSNDYRTTIRLEWPMDSTTQAELNKFLKPLNLTIGATSAIARRTSRWSTTGPSCQMLTHGSLVFRTEITLNQIKLEATFEFSTAVTTMTLTLNSKTSQALQSLLNWVQSLVPGDQKFDFGDLQGQSFGSSNLGEFHFRRITIGLVDDERGSAKLSTFSMDMEVGLHHSPNPSTLFLLTYTYQKGQGSTVNAKLWCSPPTFPQEAQWLLLPEYEKYPTMTPVSIEPSNWPKSLDLAALGGFEDLPDFLPTEILTAEFRANKKGIAFGGSMRPKPAKGKVPTFSIAEITLEVSYEWGNGAGGTFNGAFSIKALLQQPKGAKYGWPTQLIGTVAYSSNPSRWTLSGTVYDLYASTLAQFFDMNESIQAAVMPILESIRVQYLDITYNYARQEASSFDITGILVIGFHLFTLNFHHSETGWTFVATAESAKNHNVKSTVGDLVTSVAGRDMNLPDFISNIGVQVSKDNKMELVIKKSQPAAGPESMVILLTVKLGNFTLRYIQFREVVPVALAAATPTQRVLIASMNQLPGSDIPLVGQVGQPYDEVMFAWVQGQDGLTGLTKRQLDTVNKVLLELSQQPLPYKPVKKGEPVATDVLLLQGMHFMLMRKANTGPSTVALDYAFNKPKEKAKSLAADGVEDKGSRMAPYERSEGPLSIKNIGFKYSTGSSGKESILAIRLDAYAKIGPVEFALLGLTLGLNFAGASRDGAPLTLDNLPDPYISLDGLQASFDRPPIEIAGMLQYKNTDKEESFAGALVVSYVPWRFQAAGYYGVIKDPQSHDEFKSFFLYCVLQGPLITFQFATIEGVCGGFGYNSNLTFPTPQNVKQFPLISDSGSAPSPDGGPNQIMEQLLSTRWFFPRKESFWVAAGLTVKAFEILSVQAVLVIQWNPEVEIGIFGLAVASIPGGKTTKRFAHVELGVTATLSFRTGVMKIEGELTPASFILDPSCHLQGGFALYTWFDSRDDQSVKVSQPPRLGISWQFGNAISISGQAYFAITPKACMGGGRLDVALSLNPLFAYFNAFVDFLINFKPFSFIAEGGLTVGVRFTLDLWLVCINIKVEIGARLYIEGPPIRGRVHVDFWVFGFDVNFGAEDQSKPEALSLDEFIEVVCQTHTSGIPSFNALPTSSGAESDADKDPEAHVFAVQEGLIPQDKVKSTPSGEMWVVRAATFEFSVTCKFAIDKAIVITPTSQGDIENEVPGTNKDIYAKPMYTESPIKSTLRIKISPDSAYLMNEEFSTEPLWDSNQSIRKDVPLALWGKYDRSSDPSYNKNPESLLKGTSEKSVDLMMGVHLMKPEPLPSQDKTVPFDVEKFQIQKMAADTPIALPSESTSAFKPIPDTGKKQWEDVRKVWTEKESAAQKTVNLWESLGLAKLGWAKKKIESAGHQVLTGSKPQKVVDNLPKYYLFAPQLSGP